MGEQKRASTALIECSAGRPLLALFPQNIIVMMIMGATAVGCPPPPLSTHYMMLYMQQARRLNAENTKKWEETKGKKGRDQGGEAKEGRPRR